MLYSAYERYLLPATEDTRLTTEDAELAGFDKYGCISCAEYVQSLYPSTKIIGFLSLNNPLPLLSILESGHEFAVVDDRYIVDIWSVGIRLVSEHKVLDLRNPTHQEIILNLYGDKALWFELKNNDWISYQYSEV
mgnify:CR=1 FL=1